MAIGINLNESLNKYEIHFCLGDWHQKK